MKGKIDSVEVKVEFDYDGIECEAFTDDLQAIIIKEWAEGKLLTFIDDLVLDDKDIKIYLNGDDYWQRQRLTVVPEKMMVIAREKLLEFGLKKINNELWKMIG